MEKQTAVDLVSHGVDAHNAQFWSDLGCGSGMFTFALDAILPQGSTILAIDKDENLIQSIRQSQNGNYIQPRRLDFVNEELNLENLDGLLMANSLHFVKDKFQLLQRLSKSLKPNGRLIIIEYDIVIPNPWVPYPVSFEKLISLSRRLGWTAPEKLQTSPSAYGREIYSAILFPVQQERP